jgi:hypothetical protein
VVAARLAEAAVLRAVEAEVAANNRRCTLCYND